MRPHGALNCRPPAPEAIIPLTLMEKVVLLMEQVKLENPVKQAKVREYEKQIDQMVYKRYGSTEEDIRIVENSS